MPAVPINPAILAWAIDDANLSVDAISAAVGRSTDTVYQWLSGEAKPFKGDLEKLAHRVGRSTQFFFLPKPPAQSKVTAKFRGAIAGESADPAAELSAIRSVKGVQDLARWAAEIEGYEPVDLPEDGGAPEAYASLMRSHLRWNTTTDQVNATSKSATFKALRGRVESLGVVVIYRSMGVGNCRGFSLPDTLAPTIAINSDHKLPTLRTYTLLHELGHIARGSAAVCHDEDSVEERWCDKFAAAFLMPESHLRAYFKYYGWSSVRVDEVEDRIRLISNRYKASWQSVAIRLRSLGLADQAVVDAVFEYSGELNDPRGFAQGGRTTPVIRYEEFGSTFTRAVVGLRDANRLTEFDARRQLNVDKKELAALSALASGVA